jgi:hypothetical protein
MQRLTPGEALPSLVTPYQPSCSPSRPPLSLDLFLPLTLSSRHGTRRDHHAWACQSVHWHVSGHARTPPFPVALILLSPAPLACALATPSNSRQTGPPLLPGPVAVVPFQNLPRVQPQTWKLPEPSRPPLSAPASTPASP